MLRNILPISLAQLITTKFNIAGIYEVRIRTAKPIYINYFGEYIKLRDSSQSVIYADPKLIEYVITHTTEMSVYKYNSQIRQGFITTQDGVRIGLAGEVVQDENGEVKTIKNLTSLVIRIPHEIKDCAVEIMPFIADCFEVKNTLIISSPGCGKTTIIRDIARQLGRGERLYNILVVDERYEIAGAENGIARMDVGTTADVVSGGNKDYSFTNGIRSLKPDVIVTDEIGFKSDVFSIKNAILSGVKVIATAHAKDLSELKKKPVFSGLIRDKIFERIVVISSRDGMGTLEQIFNSDLEPLV